MSADRNSDFGHAVEHIVKGRVDSHRILCFLCGYLEGDEEFRRAIVKEVHFYLQGTFQEDVDK